MAASSTSSTTCQGHRHNMRGLVRRNLRRNLVRWNLRRFAQWSVPLAVGLLAVWFVPGWPAWGRALFVGLAAGVWIGAALTEYYHRRY